MINKVLSELKKRVPGKLIMLTSAGSRLYGTHQETSDWDFSGIFIARPEYYLGLKRIEQVRIMEGKLDVTIYEIQKFFKLAMGNNPNIVELLFIFSPIIETEEYRLIRENRWKFISRKVADRFIGYALSQYNRMFRKVQGFQELLKIKEILEKEVKKDPLRLIITISELTKLSREEGINLKFSSFSIPKGSTVKNALKIVNDRIHSASHRKDEWGKGQDSKFLLHTIRLLREGATLLKGEELIFPLPYREELKSIRRNRFTFEDARSLFEREKEKFKEIEEKTTLPKTPDFNFLNSLLIKLIRKNLIEGGIK